MTLLIQEANLTVEFTTNLVDLTLDNLYTYILTSQWSHQPVEITCEAIETTARYTTFTMTFPTGFGNEHKNGVYNWQITRNSSPLEKGLVKIITEPGGSMGTTNFDSGINKEERIADVFYRPNY